ncbi:hypothetical protein U1Q18_021038, partial [Sarracenia purpurea var. burkii]
MILLRYFEIDFTPSTDYALLPELLVVDLHRNLPKQSLKMVTGEAGIASKKSSIPNMCCFFTEPFQWINSSPQENNLRRRNPLPPSETFFFSTVSEICNAD